MTRGKPGWEAERRLAMRNGMVDVAVPNVKQSGPGRICLRAARPNAAPGCWPGAPLQPGSPVTGAGIPPTTLGTPTADMPLTPAQLLPATREIIQEL